MNNMSNSNNITWIFPKNMFDSSPTILAGCPKDVEMVSRAKTAKFIEDLGLELKWYVLVP